MMIFVERANEGVVGRRRWWSVVWVVVEKW